jgi:hypothetical protein
MKKNRKGGSKMKKILIIVTLILAMAMAIPAMAADPFPISNGSHPLVTHAKYHRIIIEDDNVSIEYQEGYLNADGEFVSLGVNHIFLKDEPAKEATEDSPAVEAVTDFTDFMKEMGELGMDAAIDNVLKAKLGGVE